MSKSKQNKSIQASPRSKRKTFQKVIMWFLAIILVVSMVLPAILGFMY